MARIVGVLWDNSDSKQDCYSDQAPFFKESCYGPLDAAVKAATEAGVWVILTARCAFAAGQAYDTVGQHCATESNAADCGCHAAEHATAGIV